MSTHTITITDIPEDRSPMNLAREGEHFALEAMGPGPEHPSPEAWARAGISTSMILRHMGHDGRPMIPLPLLVAFLASNADPMFDASTPQRAREIGGYQSVQAEWLNGPSEEPA